MLKIIHISWWKYLKASGRMTMSSHTLSKGLTKHEALHWAHWQAVAFQLPLAQQEAAGWWAPLPTIPDFNLEISCLPPTSSDFWVMRQQKTMALAMVLQACTEESGFPTGVLCDAALEPQRYMAPLLALSGSEIVEKNAEPPLH